MARHELQDLEWELVNPLVPKSTAKTGRPPRDRRQMLNGVLWVLSTGSQWRDVPERFGPWETVYGYFRSWRADGVFDRILAALHLRMDRDGKIDWDLWCIDGTSIRASRSAAGATKKAAGTTPTNPTTTPSAGPAAASAASSRSSSMGMGRRSRST